MRNLAAPLTVERLRALLTYDPLTGIFTRRIATGYRNSHPAGKVCGCLDKDSGYVRISVDGRHYWAHRLAWFHVHGEWAPFDVDHKDRVRHHNWIDNLRSVTRAENLQNQVEPNAASKSGIRGVHWDKARKRWRVELSVGNKTKLIGRFDDIELARGAYLAAKQRFHPGSLL